MYLEKIKEAYGEYYNDNKDLIDSEGWLRICNKTTPSMVRHLFKFKDEFDSKVESTPDMFKTYIRPKVLKS